MLIIFRGLEHRVCYSKISKSQKLRMTDDVEDENGLHNEKKKKLDCRRLTFEMLKKKSEFEITVSTPGNLSVIKLFLKLHVRITIFIAALLR